MPILRRIIILRENGERKKTRLNFNMKFPSMEKAEKFFREFRDSYPKLENERIALYPHYRSNSKCEELKEFNDD